MVASTVAQDFAGRGGDRCPTRAIAARSLSHLQTGDTVMARLDLMPGLTCGHSETLEQQIHSTHRGQAYFANTGPFGATCGECAFLGYYQQHRNKAGDVIKSTYHGGCEKFRRLTGDHGPVVPANAAAVAAGYPGLIAMGRPVFVLRVQAEPGVHVICSLRAWLKEGLRTFGLRCVSIEEATE